MAEPWLFVRSPVPFFLLHADVRTEKDEGNQRSHPTGGGKKTAATMSTTVYVGNVESTVDEFTLKSIFENCGAVIGVRLAGCVCVLFFAGVRAGGRCASCGRARVPAGVARPRPPLCP